MNPIIIPKQFVYKSKEFYFDYIENNLISFLIKSDNIQKIIDEIEHNNNFTNSFFVKQNFLYFLYKYVKNTGFTLS